MRGSGKKWTQACVDLRWSALLCIVLQLSACATPREDYRPVAESAVPPANRPTQLKLDPDFSSFSETRQPGSPAPDSTTVSPDDADPETRHKHRAAILTEKLESSPATPEGPVRPDDDEIPVPHPPSEIPTATAANSCDRLERNEIPYIDRTRELLEEKTCDAALWLDGLFGDHGDAEAARRTRGYVELSNVYSQFDGFDSRGRLHVEFDLPTMRNRLSAFVGREDEEDFVRGRTEADELRLSFPNLSEQNQWLAGLGYRLPTASNLQMDFRVGVRGLGPPTAFVQGRLRYTLFSDNNQVGYVSSTPFWTTTDGAGVTQSLDFSRVLNRYYLLRMYSVGTISQRTVGLNWRSSIILYHTLLKQRGLAYEVFIRGQTNEPVPLNEYGARVLYRYPFLKDRLVAEWAAGYSFPRTDPNLPRDGSANIGLSIQLPFGDATL